jgi:hypothetical protein
MWMPMQYLDPTAGSLGIWPKYQQIYRIDMLGKLMWYWALISPNPE